MTDDYEVNKVLIYAVCAKEFGWTPKEADEVDSVLLDYILYANGELNKELYKVK